MNEWYCSISISNQIKPPWQKNILCSPYLHLCDIITLNKYFDSVNTLCTFFSLSLDKSWGNDDSGEMQEENWVFWRLDWHYVFFELKGNLLDSIVLSTEEAGDIPYERNDPKCFKSVKLYLMFYDIVHVTWKNLSYLVSLIVFLFID